MFPKRGAGRSDYYWETFRASLLNLGGWIFCVNCWIFQNDLPKLFTLIYPQFHPRRLFASSILLLFSFRHPCFQSALSTLKVGIKVNWDWATTETKDEIFSEDWARWSSSFSYSLNLPSGWRWRPKTFTLRNDSPKSYNNRTTYSALHDRTTHINSHCAQSLPAQVFNEDFDQTGDLGLGSDKQDGNPCAHIFPSPFPPPPPSPSSP